jgi:ubiquinone/menaquinone biosynthesis C-methylase UbiE/ADP-ribose pyrophosphatase YjhB (NUDIX family)
MIARPIATGVGSIIVAGTKILLAQRINSHGNGTWTSPGGHPEANETHQGCAIRETQEESGLQLDPSNIIKLGITDDVFPDDDKHYHTTFFACHVDENVKPMRKEPNKFATNWQWFDILDLPSPLFIPMQNALKQFFDIIFPGVKMSRQYRAKFWSDGAQGTGPFENKPVDFEDPFNLAEFSKHVSQDAAILDFGCGYGRIPNFLGKNGYSNVTGVDFAEGMIARGEEQYPHLKGKLKVLAPDYNRLPFEDNSFDALTAFTVLNAIPTDDELNKLFAEFKRVLKPQGILYIYEFMLTDFKRDTDRYNRFQENNSHKNLPYGLFNISSGAIIRHFTKQAIEGYMRDFTVLWHSKNEFKSMNGNPAIHGQWISNRK